MKNIMLTLAGLLVLSGPALADDDHDRARKAVEQGLVLPFTDILARAESAYPGQLVEAELEEEKGKLVYEIKMLTADGRVVKLEYDARTGELLKTKERSPRK